MVDISNSLVYPVPDSTEAVISKTIEGIQRMIKVHHPPSQEGEEKGEDRAATGKEPAIKISLAAKRHWELQIKTLKDAPRDPDKIRELLKIKQRQYAQSMVAEEIQQPLVTEIEMLHIRSEC